MNYSEIFCQHYNALLGALSDDACEQLSKATILNIVTQVKRDFASKLLSDAEYNKLIALSEKLTKGAHQ